MELNYKDSEWLHDQYWNQMKSTPEIASLFNCNPSNIRYWLEKLNIPIRSVSQAQRRELNHSWKGGKTINKGHVLILKPEHHRVNKIGYVREHILIAEQTLKRLLKENEIVHHINGIKDDNQPENLYVYENASEHKKTHDQLQRIAYKLINLNIIKFNREIGEYYYGK